MQSTYKVLLNQLVSVSPKDQVLGPIDKWNAHLNTYITSKEAIPHRAFSIFLFNSKNQLFFQRRSKDKKTFPLCWTNTCCSHPNMIQYEGQKDKKVEHIRDALHRALDRQLKMNLREENFYLVDKIFYKAQGRKGEQFGEFEVDYVFLCKLNSPEVKYEMVPEEVCEVEWVAQKQIENFIKVKTQLGCAFSPWFLKMFHNGLLSQWWNSAASGKLENVGSEDETPVREL